jgi:hypothetical protein
MMRIAAAVLFWVAALAFLAVDATRATGRDRFAEPPPLALGSERAAGAGHCSAAPGR